ncbi:tetratricopeptide repeat protein [Nitrosomonas sp.]|uniref:tetratricopeptide repeat protein n=1 Tax=Nitrosomonas sp. TaxID=42353 RepID=UPI001D7669D1|nr:tetratricopeptide repeat protein [Nitrosomonas sp.]MCB1949000.1 tetratricopeptide repeat protein [Nitrosomonas sp.]MCP5243344.1 tetratricopeptide repeat protein [Burkholderiales bacterium]MCP5292853.1 tetratricopeptide repeat protein [Burkholderiales bacterium]MDR4515056.1 tetratricopeptide repeat protein [Nitrosomonas sp.]
MNTKKLTEHPIIWILVFLLILTRPVFAGPYCGEVDNTTFGPFDYTDPTKKEELKVVETHHFDRNVENLISGTTSSIGGDLNYTLSAFPNHHRALHTLSRLALRDKTSRPEGTRYTVLCYFDRAVRFKPNDAVVRVIFSNHLLKENKLNMALEQLQIAVNIEPDNPTTNYNLGLLYLKKKNYEKALYHAKKAYAQNFPLPGLKNRLAAVGKWKE